MIDLEITKSLRIIKATVSAAANICNVYFILSSSFSHFWNIWSSPRYVWNHEDRVGTM